MQRRRQVLCADFPVYVSGAKVPGDNLTVTSTLGAGEDSLADVFTGASTKVALPTGLQAIIDGNPFKFDTLAEGLQQYLFYTETALRTASNNGEMPVIGKDLQAGADFMGDTRAKIDHFIAENGDPSTVGPATTLLTTTLADKLGIVVNGPTGVQVDFTCKRVLEPPAGPPAGDHAWRGRHDRVPLQGRVHLHRSPARSPTLEALGPERGRHQRGRADRATKYNTVTWTKVTGATGYKILRATQTGTTRRRAASAYPRSRPSATSRRTTTTRDDRRRASRANPNLPGTVCPDDTSVTKIEGVTLGLTLGQGDVSADKGCEDDPHAGASASAASCPSTWASRDSR